MGATTFEETAIGFSPRTCFKDLVDGALQEYGSDPYSGTIATTEYCGECKKISYKDKYYSKLTKKEIADLEKALDEESDSIGKRDCMCINCGISKMYLLKATSKIVSRAKSEKYFVESKDNTYRSATYYKIEDAREKAIELSVREGVRYDVANEKGKLIVSTTLEQKELTRKPTRTLKPNECVKFKYVFKFYGVAAC